MIQLRVYRTLINTVERQIAHYYLAHFILDFIKHMQYNTSPRTSQHNTYNYKIPLTQTYLSRASLGILMRICFLIFALYSSVVGSLSSWLTDVINGLILSCTCERARDTVHNLYHPSCFESTFSYGTLTSSSTSHAFREEIFKNNSRKSRNFKLRKCGALC